jgi:1,4-alpha-glucan branching enzyme
LRHDPIHRKHHHHRLTFRGLYQFSERYVLPLSHDEVVHGKGSLYGRMPGDEWQRFANLRLLFAWQLALPGKKLLFMASELGEVAEWDHDRGIDWNRRLEPLPAGLERWVADLNLLYRREPALHRREFDPEGFRWVDVNDVEQSVLSLLRSPAEGGEPVLAVFNFTPVPRYHYRIGAPHSGFFTELLNGDAETYGGSGVGNLGGVTAIPTPHHDFPAALDLVLPPLAGLFLQGGGRR